VYAVEPIKDVFPVAQLVHTLKALAPDTPEYVPVGHGVHTVGEVAPTVIEYVPAGQFKHAPEELTPYAPARQSAHTLAPSNEYVWAAQAVHTVGEVAPTAIEYVPAGQPVHETLPLSLLNLPAAHAVHAPPSGPVYPMLHLQFEIFFCDAENADVDAVGHAKQIADLALVIAKWEMEICTSPQTLHSELLKLFTNKYLPRKIVVHVSVYGGLLYHGYFPCEVSP